MTQLFNNVPQPGATINKQSPLFTKLAAWWPMVVDHDGQTAYDASGNGFHAAYNGVVARATDGSINFPGANGDFLSVTNGTNATLRSNIFSVSLWIRATAHPANGSYWISAWEGNSESWGLNTTATGELGTFFRITGDTANTSFTTTEQVAVGKWYHVGAIVDATTPAITCYINGLEAPGTLTNNGAGINNQSVALEIGRLNTTFGAVNGRIADIRYWARAISPSEMLECYLNPWSLYQRRNRGFSFEADTPVVSAFKYSGTQLLMGVGL